MKWNHLPVAGGIYDQHPDLVDMFQIIFAARNDQARKEQEQQRSKQNQQRAKVAGRGRRH
jgi:hypothetical protein